jgi:hypothetical protein
MTANAAGSGNTGKWTQIGTPAATFSSTSSPTATISVPAAGTYTFTWTISKNACTTSDDVVVVYNDACLLSGAAVSAGVVVEEPTFTDEDDIELYPNPAVSTFTIVLAEEGPAEVQLNTLTGLIVRKIASIQRSVTIDVSDIANGIYIVQIRQRKRTAWKKVKVMH